MTTNDCLRCRWYNNNAIGEYCFLSLRKSLSDVIVNCERFQENDAIVRSRIMHEVFTESGKYSEEEVIRKVQEIWGIVDYLQE